MDELRADAYQPADWTEVLWHPDPESKRYRSVATAERACGWLNTREHVNDFWMFAPMVCEDGTVRLQRRWIGHDSL